MTGAIIGLVVAFAAVVLLCGDECWFFGCIHEDDIGGGWCKGCLRDYKDQYHGPIWKRN